VGVLFCAHVRLDLQGPSVDDLRTHHATTAFVVNTDNSEYEKKLPKRAF
jgi:hypothetical protein